MSEQGAPTWTLAAHSASPEETVAIAAALSALCGPGDVFVMTGELGAGKTTFAQGLAQSLGVEGPVTSPTFTLVRQYRCGVAGQERGILEFLHADLYRLEDTHEIEDLALPELIEDSCAVALIEWGERAVDVLAESALRIVISDGLTPDERELQISGCGDWGAKAPEVETALLHAAAAGARP